MNSLAIEPKFYICGRCDHIDESLVYTSKCQACGWEGELDTASTKEGAERIVAEHKLPGYNRAKGRLEPVKQKQEELISDNVAEGVAHSLREGIPPIKWRIHNLLTDNGIVIVASPPKQFKTFLAIHASLAISTGGSFLDRFPTNTGTVLYLDEENGKANLLRRFKQLADGHDILIPENILYTSFRGLKLDGPNRGQLLEELIQIYKPDVVILDSMVRFMEGDEDKATDVRKVFENLKRLLSTYAVSFIILHHTRKGNGTKTKSLDDLRGSSDFGAFADAILGVEGTDTGFTFRVIANRHVGLMEVIPQEIEVQSDRQAGPITLINHGAGQSRKVRAKVAIIEWLHSEHKEEFSSSEAIALLEQSGYERKAYYEALRDLKRDGEVAEHRRGVYRLQSGSFAKYEEGPR